MHYARLRNENFHSFELHYGRPLCKRRLSRAKNIHAAAMQIIARRGLGWVGREPAQFARSIRKEVALEFNWFVLLQPFVRMLLKFLIPILINWLENELKSNTFGSEGHKKNALEQWALQVKESR